MADASRLHFDHVGSLLRPKPLFEARQRLLGVHDADHNLGAHDHAELRQIEDDHIADAVKLQEECGLQLVTDGDFRRRSWWTDFFMSLDGPRVTYAGRSPLTVINAKGETRPLPTVSISKRISWKGSINVEPFKFLKSVTRREPKVTLPPPTMIHFQRDENYGLRAYDDDVDAFFDDMIKVYRQEVRALADAGCKHLQLDECNMVMLCDPRHQQFARSRGEDPIKLVEKYAWAMNEIIADRPKDMTARMHMCRGNLSGFWASEGGYDFIADTIFNTIDVDAFLMEYDTERAGDFTPLRFLPKGKMAMLGLVSTKVPELEPRDDLRRRIDEAAKYTDMSQLGICPQCGFASNVFGNPVTIDDERRKLALVVDTANMVWH
jgi:5-methyltetrahydropteroyltriglutamate--homocysteine methyltransferase